MLSQLQKKDNFRPLKFKMNSGRCGMRDKKNLKTNAGQKLPII